MSRSSAARSSLPDKTPSRSSSVRTNRLSCVKGGAEISLPVEKPTSDGPLDLFAVWHSLQPRKLYDAPLLPRPLAGLVDQPVAIGVKERCELLCLSTRYSAKALHLLGKPAKVPTRFGRYPPTKLEAASAQTKVFCNPLHDRARTPFCITHMEHAIGGNGLFPMFSAKLAAWKSVGGDGGIRTLGTGIPRTAV